MGNLGFKVPFQKAQAQTFVAGIIGLMVFLTILALASALSVSDVIRKWEAGLYHGFTVEVPHENLQGQDVESLTHRVVQRLQADHAITRTEVIATQDILQDLNGSEATELEGLKLPLLIEGSYHPDFKPHFKSIEQDLKQLVPQIQVRDHTNLQGEAMGFVHAVLWLSICVALFIALSALITIGVITHNDLTFQRRVLEVLHVVGATHGYISRQFEHQALNISLKGGIFGVCLALLTFLLFHWYLAPLELPLLTEAIEGGQILLLTFLVPVAIVLLSILTARWVVIRALQSDQLLKESA